LRVGEEIERIRAQADGTVDDAGDQLHPKHGQVDHERGPQDAPIAIIGLCRFAAVVIAAAHVLELTAQRAAAFQS